jgi:hypothetical protein
MLNKSYRIVVASILGVVISTFGLAGITFLSATSAYACSGENCSNDSTPSPSGSVGIGITDTVPGNPGSTNTPQPVVVFPPGVCDIVEKDGESVELPCKIDDYLWMSGFGRYCKVDDIPDDSKWWDPYRDRDGNPTGVFYECWRKWAVKDNQVILICSGLYCAPDYEWVPDFLPTPDLGAGSEDTVRVAVAGLQLHPPTVGAGAFISEGAEEFGPTWVIGAPLWLWVDKNDPLQWGSHTLSADNGVSSITATVTSKKVIYDPGDGSKPIVCWGPGAKRIWRADDLLSNKSPSGCQHVYYELSELGNVNSFYEVSATVVWEVQWSSSTGERNSFIVEMESVESSPVHVGQRRVVPVPNPTPAKPPPGAWPT